VSAVRQRADVYNGTSVEADKVIYDQKTKRLHAEGNIRMTDAEGRITYANVMDLSDDYRDGFVDSLRVDNRRPDANGGDPRRPLQRQLHGVRETASTPPRLTLHRTVRIALQVRSGVDAVLEHPCSCRWSGRRGVAAIRVWSAVIDAQRNRRKPSRCRRSNPSRSRR